MSAAENKQLMQNIFSELSKGKRHPRQDIKEGKVGEQV